MNNTQIQDVKKGDYIKRIRGGKPTKKVYIKKEYCKFNKGWACVDFDDMSNYAYIKKNTTVITGFTF